MSDPKRGAEGIEYQVYHPALEALMEPVSTTTQLQAEGVVAQLSKALGGWHIRPVELGKEPIPTQVALATSITVHEARKLMAKHGQDILVMVAWSESTGQVNIVTAGSSLEHSNGALSLGDGIARGLQLNMGERTEDRRHEHPA